MDILPFEAIDRLLLVELRESNIVSGIIPRLYELVREDFPLSYLTAKAFFDQPKSRIGIVTGVELFPFFPHGEIDGLPGSVFLARALSRFGHKVTILTEDGCQAVIDALIYEFNVENTECINVSTMKDQDILKYADKIDIGVSVEKIGVNSKGRVHSIEGENYDNKIGPFYGDLLINCLNDQGKTTIGYGDGGNEIGFGKIYHRVREIVPKGAKCDCPCGDGLATVTPTSILWPVNVSNFGAYGTVAGLAMLYGNPELAITSDEQLKALDVSVANGAVDSWNGLPIPGENGIPALVAASFVNILKGIVDKSFEKHNRPFKLCNSQNK